MAQETDSSSSGYLKSGNNLGKKPMKGRLHSKPESTKEGERKGCDEETLRGNGQGLSEEFVHS